MRPKTDHRPALLRTAARLFAEKPYHEVLMDAVALETGVAKGTIYRFFKTKDELYASVCLESLDELAEQLAEATRQPAPPLARLESMVALVIRYFHARRDFFNVLQREWSSTQPHRQSEFLARRTATRALFARVIEEGQQQGVFREVNPELAADGFLGVIRSFVRFGERKLSPDELTAHLLDLLLHGIAAPQKKGKESPCPRL